MGMSTAPEVIVARHCGMRTIAFSHISNMCMHSEEEQQQTNDVSHQEVLSMGEESCKKLTGFIVELVSSFKLPLKESGPEESMEKTQDAEVFPGAKTETEATNKDDNSIRPQSNQSPTPADNGSHKGDSA